MMLDKKQMQEIQDLKLRGYTKTEIQNYYIAQGLKPPSRPTISKYYDMDVVPEDPGIKLAKDKAFDVSPFEYSDAGKPPVREYGNRDSGFPGTGIKCSEAA